MVGLLPRPHHRPLSCVQRCDASLEVVISLPHCNRMEAPLCMPSALDPNVIVQRPTVTTNEGGVPSVGVPTGPGAAEGTEAFEGRVSPFFSSSSFTSFSNFLSSAS